MALVELLIKDDDLINNPDTVLVAFTGHRPKTMGTSYECDDPKSRWLSDATREILLDLTNDTQVAGISGMALGYDHIAAECCADLDIPFEAAVPCIGQERIWPLPSQVRYWRLLSAADRIFILHDEYSRDAMMDRNSYILEGGSVRRPADILVACWDGNEKGGTYDTIKKWGKRKPLYILDPHRRAVELREEEDPGGL